jgi:mevalonate kinase
LFFVQELIDTNQGLLSSLGVSHPALDRITAIAAKHGLHAKLTGAGGGGFAFALITPDADAATVKQARMDMEQNGFECIEAHIGGSGVQYKERD